MPKVTDNNSRRVAVNVSLPVGLLEQVDRFAEERGMSRSAFIRMCIEQAMERAKAAKPGG